MKFHHFFTHRKIFFPVFVGIMYNINVSSLEPTLSLRLKSFNISTIEIGAFYTIIPITFIFATILVQVMKKKTNIVNRLFIIMGCYMSFLASSLIGPSEVLGFPQNLGIMSAGCFIIGIGFAFFFPNCLPEIRYQVNKAFPKGKEFNNNFSAGCWRFF